MFMKRINTLLIGVGYHAKRIYLPFLKDYAECDLKACVDLVSQKEKTLEYLSSKKILAEPYFILRDRIADSLSKNQATLLDSIVKKHKIKAVIISTEPLAHLKFAKWALRANLHILLDKPITTDSNVATDPKKARKIFSDYEKLLRLYKSKDRKSNLVFIVQAQRRFHAGFIKVKEKIKEISNLTGCPVTFIQTFHADGQWTFPEEFLFQTYHPYNRGYGKLSHSGYHSLDIAIWLAQASLMPKKAWDNFNLYTEFTRPSDVLTAISKSDYQKLFPEMRKKNMRFDVAGVTGEVDAFTLIALKKAKRSVTNISCNTLHTSFSKRAWSDSTGRDLYKGNGRVRQESYVVEQGPFQSIVVNSFQSNQIQKKAPHPYAVGGEYHFDIHIFRNNALFPQLKPYEFLSLKQLRPIKDLGYSRGHQEDARRQCITSFFEAIKTRIPQEKQESNIMRHKLTTQILSAIYFSGARQYRGLRGIINERIA